MGFISESDLDNDLPQTSAGRFISESELDQPSFLQNTLEGAKAVVKLPVTVASSAYNAVADLPENLDYVEKMLATPGMTSEVAKDVAEDAARFVGAGGAMTAGGVLGAGGGALLGALGGPLSPITIPLGSLLGGASGSATGKSAFDYVNELTGSDAPRDFPERKKEFAYNLGASSVIPAVAGSIKAASPIVSNILAKAEKTADKMEAASTGITTADLTKSARSKGLVGEAGELSPNLLKSSQKVSKTGIFKEAKTAEERFLANRGAVEALDDGLSTVLNSIDEIRGSQKFYPQFKNAEKFVKRANPLEKAALEKELLAAKVAVRQELDGSISSMQNAKRALYQKVYSQDGAIKSPLGAAIAQDLKQAIEASAQAVSGKSQLGATVSQLNQKMQPHLDLNPILMREVAREAGATPLKKAFQDIRTSGGVAAPLIAGSLFGVPLTGLLTSAGLLAAKSPAGQRAIVGGLRSSSKLAPVVTKIANKIPTMETLTKISPALAAAVSKPKNESQFLDNVLNKAEERMQIKDSKQKEKLIPNLVKAVTSVESAGNPNAVSNKGAQGLMQVMPATAAEIAKELGIKEYNLKDPETNTKFGTHYLNKMLNMFGGDVELALAAYNAGPGAVKKWIRDYGASWSSISKGLTADKKYKETVAYVPKVLGRLTV